MPFTDTELLILAALQSRELFGRQITRAVELLTDGKRKISLAGLYTTLHRMEVKGLIAGRWADEDESSEGARRRYYQITGAGARSLADVRSALRPNRKIALGEA